jgi:hypothetical protein
LINNGAKVIRFFKRENKMFKILLNGFFHFQFLIVVQLVDKCDMMIFFCAIQYF